MKEVFMEDILDINTLFGPYPLANADLGIDTLLFAMRTNKVQTACTYSTLGLFLDPLIGNAATRAACSDHSELIPVGVLNPTLYLGNKEYLSGLKSEGFRLIRLFPTAHQYSADFAPFRTLVNDLSGLALPLMLQVVERGEISTFANALANYTAPIVLTNVGTKHIAELVAVLKSRSNLYVETSQLNGIGAIKAVVDAIGAERVLLGTGIPYQPTTTAVKMLEFSGITPEARKQVLGANARRILAQ